MTKSWVWPLATAGIVANGLRLRRRIEAMGVLEPTDEPVDPEHRFVVASGVSLDQATARAASKYARDNGLAALDLVPADLPFERMLDVVRMVNPATYRADPFIVGRGAGQVLLLSTDVVKRAQIDNLEGVDAAEMVRLTAKAKRHAAWDTDLALAPELRAGTADRAVTRLAELRESFPFGSPAVAAFTALWQTILTNGARRAPWGTAAALAYHAQPWLTLAGTAARPRDLTSRAPMRIAAAARDLVTTVSNRPEPRVDDTLPERRRSYEPLLTGGPEQFLEPRRADCPLCHSTSLSEQVRSGDWIQGKPGTFRLERCADCRLVFQNPRLTLDGLDIYYRDFYDGVGEEQLEQVFASGEFSYNGRVEAVARHTTPQRWLDVGTGHGHVMLAVRRRWPEVVLHGLDMSDSVEEAERRGWIDRSIRGVFPEVAPQLGGGGYDVVSMHHYLEHTRDPRAELDAVASVLQPGGHLLIELPNPDSPFGRVCGRYWGPWFQPQHQHMLPLASLERELTDRGFTVVDRELGPAHQASDFTFAAYLAANHRAPLGAVPWGPELTTATRIKRNAVFALAAPVVVGAAVVDNLIGPLVNRVPPLANSMLSNTYRVVARLDGAGSAG
jgi:SAM-dependent methyltransferase